MSTPAIKQYRARLLAELGAAVDLRDKADARIATLKAQLGELEQVERIVSAELAAVQKAPSPLESELRRLYDSEPDRARAFETLAASIGIIGTENEKP